MSTPTILILYRENPETDNQTKWSTGQQYSYNLWHQIATDSGQRLIRANIFNYDGEKFTEFWEPKDGVWQKQHRQITPDIIYDKASNYSKSTGTMDYSTMHSKQLLSREIKMINSPVFTELLYNKATQAAIFHDYMPETRFITPHQHVATDNIQVFKRLVGSGGTHVTITDDDFISPYPTVQQQFIESGSDESMDYRIIYFGAEPILALSRIAVAGSKHTNYTRGGSVEFHQLDDVTVLIEHGEKIIDRLAMFPQKIFTLDYIVSDSNTPYLIEANSMPGLSILSQNQEVAENYIQRLNEYLIAHLNS